EVYAVDPQHLLLVASDRVSAFDVVMREPIPFKGAVLTRISAFWFEKLAPVFPSHYLTASTDEILEGVPALRGHREQLEGRSMLVRRTSPVPFECVVRGYISGSAWAEYQRSGTLAGEPLAPGLVESAPLEPPVFSPATKAETGHDINVTADAVATNLGQDLTDRLRVASFELYRAGRDHAASRGIIIADTKFEFGTDSGGILRLIDEVMTPDSSRFWPADGYRPGGSQPSFDKQPLRDYLAELRSAGRWNGEAPPPPLPREVIEATTLRYLEAFRRITGQELETRA
ncbi:MAG: phosphoribosylaminoimidazolesuccinocarboxamide synthase, partial [Gemmatimonadales bacterium]|nr:phosphoribosylaminoimidazolesuccinocarboxamide synthase [Gemmatimonadales bacterium]